MHPTTLLLFRGFVPGEASNENIAVQIRNKSSGRWFSLLYCEEGNESR
jgi:hypothetical protein